jgi:hypothetical protein
MLQCFICILGFSHPEQQLPGVPHEFGVPQQLPGVGFDIFCDKLLEVL